MIFIRLAQAGRASDRESVQEYYERERPLAGNVKKMKIKKVGFFDQAGRSADVAKVFSPIKKKIYFCCDYFELVQYVEFISSKLAIFKT